MMTLNHTVLLHCVPEIFKKHMWIVLLFLVSLINSLNSPRKTVETTL